MKGKWMLRIKVIWNENKHTLLLHILWLNFLGEHDIYFNLTSKAFVQCENDGIYGLSWNEVNQCEDKFCGMLNVSCPTKERFNFFDVDKDGILTWEEYLSTMEIKNEYWICNEPLKKHPTFIT